MTIGLSPKVLLPALALAAIGAALLIIGVLAGDTTATTAGVAILGAAGIQFPIGHAAQPGNVQTAIDEPGSDELMPAGLGRIADA